MGGNITPYIAHQFRIFHIPSSTPFDRRSSLPSSDLNTSVHPHGGDSGYMNVGATVYIPSYVPSSAASIPSNSFLMTNHPYIPHGPLKIYDSFRYLVSLLYIPIVSGGYVPPHVFGGQVVYQLNNYGYMVPPS